GGIQLLWIVDAYPLVLAALLVSMGWESRAPPGLGARLRFVPARPGRPLRVRPCNRPGLAGFRLTAIDEFAVESDINRWAQK
ncbi:hypothetical protein ACKLTP_19030, partial [Paenarthrobacter ureafaciens]|uniref:hypothetical protein n=1 Tax=Paenarthrobacter ureafaciens TaxID=37931 RepID=UPI00397E6A01